MFWRKKPDPKPEPVIIDGIDVTQPPPLDSPATLHVIELIHRTKDNGGKYVRRNWETGELEPNVHVPNPVDSSATRALVERIRNR